MNERATKFQLKLRSSTIRSRRHEPTICPLNAKPVVEKGGVGGREGVSRGGQMGRGGVKKEDRGEGRKGRSEVGEGQKARGRREA